MFAGVFFRRVWERMLVPQDRSWIDGWMSFGIRSERRVSMGARSATSGRRQSGVKKCGGARVWACRYAAISEV
jgi:hypothetical protein